MERLGPRARCFQRLRAAGMGDRGIGGVPVFQPDGNSAIPQFHNNSTIPRFQPSLGHGQSAAGNGPTGPKALFLPSPPFLEMPGRGREKPPLQHSALHPLSRARRNYISINQITPAPLSPFSAARSTPEPRGRKGWERGMDPGGIGCQEWGAGVDPAFSEPWELLPRCFPRVWGLKMVLEMPASILLSWPGREFWEC